MLLLWFMVYVLSAGTLSAASIDAANLDKGGSLPLGLLVDIWDNRSSPARPEEVLAGNLDQQFKSSTSEYPGIGLSNGELWVRFVLQGGAETRTLWLESRYVMLDDITLFQKDQKGQYFPQQQGDIFPMADRPLAYRAPVFKLTVYPGENTYYLRSRTAGSNTLALFLWNERSFDEHRTWDNIILGVMFGILTAMLLYNGFLAFSFSSLTYVYYVIFVATMLATHCGLQGIWPFVFEPSLSGWLMNKGLLFVSNMVNIAGILVSMSFLNMKQYMPRWYRFFQFSLWLDIAITISGMLISYNQFVKLNTVFLAVISLTLIVAGVVAAGRGYRPAIFYSFAWFFMLANNVLNSLHYEGIYHWFLVVQFNNFPGVVMEGILMSLALGDRVNYNRNRAEKTIRRLNAELQAHLSQVETLVAERTEMIRTILDHVASGFLMIDCEGRVLPGFSRSCHMLMGQTICAGQKFSELLPADSDSSRLFTLSIQQVFLEQLPLDVTLSQVPHLIRTANRSLQLEASGVLGTDGKLKSILLTLQDVTELRKKQKESRHNRVLIRILRDLESFRTFVGTSYEIVQKLRKSVDRQEIRFLLHTLKGNCQVFKLTDIAHAIHELEDCEMINTDHLDQVEKLMIHFLKAHDDLLKTVWGPYLPDVHVMPSQLAALEGLVARISPDDLQRRFHEWILDAKAQPAGKIVKPMLDSCKLTAKRLGKKVSFRLIGDQVNLKSPAEVEIVELLNHLLRNALAHGIESDRAAVGKPTHGEILLSFHEFPDRLVIVCSDDGQGFDRVHWEQVAVTRQLVASDLVSKLSFSELIRCVSKGGYSTSRKISLEAGRGVGLEGFFAAVEQHGGIINLDSAQERGSRFEIILPRRPEHQLSQAS